MNIFDLAPTVPAKKSPAPRKKIAAGGGNIFMRLNIAKKQARDLANENIKLRAENDRLHATVKRLQSECDALWNLQNSGKSNAHS